MSLTTALQTFTQWCERYDAQPMVSLIALAFVTHFSGRHFCSADRLRTARRIAVIVTFPYLLHAYPAADFSDVFSVGSVLLRTLILHMMLLGVMLHIVPLVIWMHRNLGGVCRSLYKRRQEFSRASAERRQAAEEERILREHPPQPPLPYSERLRQQLTSAEEQYHAEAGLIRSTDVLDATEREVALMHAKQRFLERLRGMLG